jgi:hypothetical protein
MYYQTVQHNLKRRQYIKIKIKAACFNSTQSSSGITNKHLCEWLINERLGIIMCVLWEGMRIAKL